MNGLLFLVGIAALAGCAQAGTVVWDGMFNDTTLTNINAWSWSNQVGVYQWYIHGSGQTSDYVSIDASYANSDSMGAMLTIDSTSQWNSDGMWRTELIPQTKQNLGTGTLHYHFSIKIGSDGVPSSAYEHQIFFFESHFTELKYGGSGDTTLKWMANSQQQWETEWESDTWYNFAYEINFDSQTVGLWQSTGMDALTQVVAPVSASTSTNSADFHVGVLRLQASSGGSAEKFYVDGVYIESGDITTAIGSGSASSGSSSSIAPKATTAASTSAVAATTSQSSFVVVVSASLPATMSSAISSVEIPSTSAVISSASGVSSATTVIGPIESASSNSIAPSTALANTSFELATPSTIATSTAAPSSSSATSSTALSSTPILNSTSSTETISSVFSSSTTTPILTSSTTLITSLPATTGTDGSPGGSMVVVTQVVTQVVSQIVTSAITVTTNIVEVVTETATPSCIAASATFVSAPGNRTTVSTSSPAAPSSGAPGKRYAQCGGKAFSGSTTCTDGLACKTFNEYYSQCCSTGSGSTC